MAKAKNKEKVLLRAAWISTFGNAILSVSKITIGLITGSLAVLGDGIDSATDVVISLVMIFTTRIMNRPPNRKYAYGFEKAESVATKILSLIIFFAGAQMFISSIQSIFDARDKVIPGQITIVVTVVSIIGKLLLSWYQYKKGKQIESSLLIANAINMRNDVLISIGVLVGLGFTFILNLPILDSITGLLISIFIIHSSVKIFMDTNVELMDGVKDEKVYNLIFDAVNRVDGAYNPHSARIRSVGNQYVVGLDIEVDGNITLHEAHKIAHQVEEEIASIVDIFDIIVHVEPMGKAHPEERFGINPGQE